MAKRVKGLAAGLSLLALLGACEHYTPAPPPLVQIEAEQGGVVEARELVVLARTASLLDEAIEKSQAKGFALLRRETLADLGFYMAVLRTPQGLSPAVAIQQIEALAPGVSAGVNHAYVGAQSAAPGPAGRLYADAMLGWPQTGCPARRAIGIIDAAIDPEEAALKGAQVQVRKFTDNPAPDDHGTALAVIMVGQGRLSNAALYNAAVMGAHAGAGRAASVEAIVRGLDWLLSEDAKVINMSLEGPYNRILERSLQRAVQLGAVIVASNGNAGPHSAPRYPAAFNDVIAVTAVDAARRPYAQAVQGAHTDFAAPGVDVFAPLAGRERYVSGTSFAAAYVAAAVAALPQADQLTPALAQAALAASAVDLGAPGHDPQFGHGLVQINAACANTG